MQLCILYITNSKLCSSALPVFQVHKAKVMWGYFNTEIQKPEFVADPLLIYLLTSKDQIQPVISETDAV